MSGVKLTVISLQISSLFLNKVSCGCTSRVGQCLGLLGAGTGLGSCAAPPFRASQVEFDLGCPRATPCCSEFGYCRNREDWEFGFFRDCNGESNGKSLDIDTIIRELEAPDFVGRPAGLIGPRIKLRNVQRSQRDTEEETNKNSVDP